MSSDCHIWARHSSKVAILKNIVVYHSNLNDKQEICSSLSLLPKYQIHIQPCILTAYPIYIHTCACQCQVQDMHFTHFCLQWLDEKVHLGQKNVTPGLLNKLPDPNQPGFSKGHALGRFEPWASSPKPHKTGIKLIYIATHFPQVPETTSWQLGI